MLRGLALVAPALVLAGLGLLSRKAHKETVPPKPRRRVGRRAAAETAAAAAAAPAPSGAARAPATATLAITPAPAPSSGVATYLLLLLHSLLAATAITHADALYSLRPAGLDISNADWRRLVIVAVLASTAAGALAWLAARRHAYSAAAAAANAAAKAAAAGAGAGSAAPAPVASAPPQHLSGVWLKDKEASDSMDKACDAMQLGGIVRTAIKLIKGVQIEDRDGRWRMSVLSSILWFKVTETYSLDGTRAQFKRRDLRRGRHTGWVERCAATGGMLLRVEWDDPHGGHGIDHFHLAAPDVLHVDTTLATGGHAVHYRQVYRRKQ